MEEKFSRLFIIVISLVIVFIPFGWAISRKRVLLWVQKGYAGTDEKTDDREMGKAVSHLIQLVGLTVLVAMIVVSFVDKYDFGDWKWIIFFIVIGAQVENISSWLPGIIQAFKKTKIG
jgi:hypothetical protein